MFHAVVIQAYVVNVNRNEFNNESLSENIINSLFLFCYNIIYKESKRKFDILLLIDEVRCVFKAGFIRARAHLYITERYIICIFVIIFLLNNNSRKQIVPDGDNPASNLINKIP